MKLRSVRLAAGVVAVGLALAACSSSGGSGGTSGSSTAGGSSGASGSSSASSTSSSTSTSTLSGSITVFAAASLTEAFTTLGAQFQAAHPGTTVTFKFDASSALATQITQGNPADVFASASTKNMTAVTAAGDTVKATNFVSNTMEIATPPGNPAKITSVADLAKSGVKVALCDVAVPCGATAQKVFDNAKITVKPVSREADVKSTLAKVEIKEVDAGVVYVTDVRAAGSKVTGVPIPSSINASTTYPISVLKNAKNTALATAWVDYVLSADGQKVLQADGFSAP